MKQTILTIFIGLLAALSISAQEVSVAAQEVTVAAQEVIVAEDEMPAIVQDSLPADSLQADTLLVLPYPQILLDMPNVNVIQDSLVTLLMKEKIAGVERGEQEMEGYRVQIYSSNHPKNGKINALQIEQRVKEVIKESVYVIYATPSWKVRLGDFLTKEEAEVFRDTFKELFPDLADYTYIVRDKVKIKVAH